jgi:hypothetical protein
MPPGKDVFLTGPSDAGNADPGYLTAVAIFQVTICLLINYLNIRSLVILNALDRLVDEVDDAFAEAETKLEADAKRRQAADAHSHN